MVIGNTYKGEDWPLPTCQNDAEEMCAKLQECGFKVNKYIDLDKKEMDDVFNEFAGLCKIMDTVVLFFSGHGIEYLGEQYFLPVDMADVETPQKIKFRAFSCDKAKTELQKSVGNGKKIILSDCCHVGTEQVKKALK